MSKPWLPFARKTYALEKTYLPRVTRHLKSEIKSFVETLRAQGKEAALNALQMSVSTDLQPLLQKLHGQAGIIGARLTYNELQPYLKESKKAANFGRNARWEAAVLEVLGKSGLEFVLDISDTTRDFILKQFELGIKENWTLEQIIQKITFDKYWEARARRIVRTEIVRAANIGHEVAAREFPFEVNKKWIAAGDHRTRHSHHSVNNQMVGEDDLFKVPIYKGKVLLGYEDMTAPGDPKASPGNTINCRCRIIHQPKEDAQGNYIYRNANQARVIPMRQTTYSDQSIRELIAASIKMDLTK